MRGLRSSAWRSVSRGPRAIGHVLGTLLQRPAFSQRTRNDAVARAWCEVVGEEIAGHAQTGRVRAGVLYVEVEGATWLHELAGFHKERILEEMRKRVRQPYIQDIVFRQQGARAIGH